MCQEQKSFIQFEFTLTRNIEMSRESEPKQERNFKGKKRDAGELLNEVPKIEI